jgi:glutamine cyclotransferase
MTNEIVKIDSKTGKVVGRIDISMLKQEASNKYPQSQETNGIAYNAITDKIYVTGKLWPTIYEIKFNH